MLEKLLIHDNSSDLGQIAESLLFYDHVTINVSESSLREIFKLVNPNVFIPFIKEHQDKIKIQYYQSQIATTSYKNSKSVIKIMSEDQVDNNPYIRYLEKHLLLPGQKGEQNDKEFTKQFLSLLTVQYENDKHFNEIINELNTENYFKEYFGNSLKKHFNYKVDQIDFELRESEFYGYEVHSNFNKNMVLGNLPLEKHLENVVFRYIYNTSLMLKSKESKSDIFMKNIDKDIVSFRTKHLLDKLSTKSEVPELFQKAVLSNGRTIRESINSGEKSFMEFISLYEKSRKFKNWIVDLETDANLIEEYYTKILTNTWAEKMPVKTIRWSIFAGLSSLVNPLCGSVLSFIDSLILDALITGWKPNQFIETDLKEFTRS